MHNLFSYDALIITGPTGIGKTAFVDLLCKCLPRADIINADVGQMYQKISIGTAKPDTKSHQCPHHLFDILSLSEDYTVSQYRKDIAHLAKYVKSQGSIPIIVGGSGFYIKSLFYPPITRKSQKMHGEQKPPLSDMSTSNMYDLLYNIDPVRANMLDKNDRYRIERAIDIWFSTGVKPSDNKPQFTPLFKKCLLISLERERNVLYKMINERTCNMMQGGWIEEVERLTSSEKDFLRDKKLIGYDDIIHYMNHGKSYDYLVKTIQQKTRRYAKRQTTFVRHLMKHIHHDDIMDSVNIQSISLDTLSFSSCNDIQKLFYQ
jgi:tRNA dimethylallyltransferase